VWKLHRYYLKELTVNAGIAFAVLFAIVLISLVARGIQRAQGGSLLDAALITLFWALDSFPHLLAISFLLATVLTFARAAQDRELTAIRSAGISPRTPMTSALLVGVLLSIVGSLCMHYVIPSVHFRKYRIVGEAARNVFLNLNLGSDRIPILETGMVLTYARRDAERGLLDCTIYNPDERLRRAGGGSPILRVDRVSIPPIDERSESLWFVLEGVRDPVSGSHASELRFDLPLRSITERNRRDERDDDLTSDQLLSEVARDVHEAPTAAMYTLNRRSCFALMPALLAPIGFCIALLAHYRGRLLAILVSLLPLVLFYGGDVLGQKLLRTTDWPGFGWTPAALLLLAGVPFCWRMLRL
jgi:lipopolysaccharide export LptBFGC system permease protein LptF